MYEESKAKGRTPRVKAMKVEPEVLLAYRDIHQRRSLEAARVGSGHSK